MRRLIQHFSLVIAICFLCSLAYGDYTAEIPGLDYYENDANDMDELTDADTTTDPPAKNEVLKWNGSNWVPAAYDYDFEFSIASFSDGEATTQLIGSGQWEASSAMSYTASYNNGPPTSADVLMSINGAAYNDVGNMDSPAYTAGTNYDGAINYPGAKDQYLRFRLDASDGVDSDIEYETAVYFRNYIFWGDDNDASGYTEADIEGLDNSEISNDYTQNKSINNAGGYIVWAYPASYSNLNYGDDYEDDGDNDFLFNGVSIAMAKDTDSLSITNSAGYTENYEVYMATTAALGNHTLSVQSSNSPTNYVWYGKTTDASGYNEADVEGCANSEATNDYTQVWDAVTIGVGEYLLFCFPKRFGTKDVEYAFYDYSTGLGFDFQAAETVGVTNVNGWSEDYYVYRSTNANLGSCTVETK